MKAYSAIILIYNPNSTNDAHGKAAKFKAAAKKAGYSVTLSPTKRRGHALELGEKFTRKYRRPLLISVSGDGGYNELINGVMAGKKHTPKSEPVVAVIGAGNANDHKRTTRGDTPLLTLIKSSEPRPIDLIRLRAGKVDRYAHSYIGLGITPEVGMELNRHSLNRFNELAIALKAFYDFRPFAILRDGKKERFGSLIFANVDSMAKVIKLKEESSIRDGKFDLIAYPYRGKLHMAWQLFSAALKSHSDAPEYSQFTFTTTAKTAVQLDGEIEELPSGAEVLITAEKQAILSLY